MKKSIVRSLRERALLLAASVVMMSATALAGEATARAGGVWAPLHEESRAVLLVTGRDIGYVNPLSCFGNYGGTLYRPAFDALLDTERPDVQRVWISTGDIVGEDEFGHTKTPKEIYERLHAVQYGAVGVGLQDLDLAGPEFLLDRSREGLPLTAANLVVYETGLTLFPPYRVIETGSGTLAVVALAPHRPSRLWDSHLAAGMIVTIDPGDALADLLPNLRSLVDRILVTGTVSDFELAKALERVEGVDFAATSANVQIRHQSELLSNTPLISVGSFGHGLGRIELGNRLDLLTISTVEVRDPFPIDPGSGAPSADDSPVPQASRRE